MSIFRVTKEDYPIFSKRYKARKEKMLHFIITVATADRIIVKRFPDDL
jgi:hypothetical protein